MSTANPLAEMPTRAHQPSRIINVIRLQYINTQTFVWVPLIIVGATVVFALIILGMIPTEEHRYWMGIQSPPWYFIPAGAMALAYSFPFSQAMSATRREFFIGTVAAAALSAAGLSLIFLLIAAFERATDGYWMNAYVAYVPDLFANGWVSAWLTYFTLPMLAFMVGFWFATIYKRWNATILTLAIIGVSLLILAIAFIITRTESWPQVGQWATNAGPTVLTLYGLGLVAVLSLGSYATLRRTIA
ncbi:hypothetical protein [Microbacterium amylolyticum]|uniref:Phosphoglycerol transferase MdoB-like AlkP superfamily enzyme n=1 Tax=Microbacterium amylolyticum TaxID=936337 RepID=A0ABS4ZIP8_9MICO|nr:hypothetical protein [Microbacterium amylolyticum]MBP2436923.1 phosphoglycerol transferase MdoB-like AlkP superfamily enzyme [Microbacterium amylolyticum]